MSPAAVCVCDGCDASWWGASKRDVLDDGWKFHDAKRGRMLVVCGDCERRFAERRAPSAQGRGDAQLLLRAVRTGRGDDRAITRPR